MKNGRELYAIAGASVIYQWYMTGFINTITPFALALICVVAYVVLVGGFAVKIYVEMVNANILKTTQQKIICKIVLAFFLLLVCTAIRLAFE